MRRRSYKRSQWKPLPKSVERLLDALQGFKGDMLLSAEPAELARKLACTRPFTILLFTEPLAQKHWRLKKYVTMRRRQICSELDEVVFRDYHDQLNREMAAYLEHNKDPEDVHLNELVRARYPDARRILKEDYRQRYPRTWRKKWKARDFERSRIAVDKKRKYDMPEPLCWGDTLSPQQFYIMPGIQQYARGCGTGSGTRANHSYYGLAFMDLSRGMQIPSYVLVYDKDNRLRYVCRSQRFMIIPDSMGCNCHVAYKTIDALMDSVPKVSATRSDDWIRLEEIVVHHRRRQ